MLSKFLLGHGRTSSKKGFFFLITGILLVGASIGLLFYSISHWEDSQSRKQVADQTAGLSSTESMHTITYNDITYEPDPYIETTLIFGVDKDKSQAEEEEQKKEGMRRNHQQADFFVLVAYNKKTGETRLLQLNRDTMVDVDQLGIFGDRIGTKQEQLCLSHTYGKGESDSARNVVNAVSRMLGGIPIDHYVALTMDAVQILNDSLGGVPVLVEEDFSSVDPSLVQGETITLMGPQALTYVRARGGVDGQTNLERMERQRKYLTSMYDKLGIVAANESNNMAKILMDISPYMVTDCSANKLSDLFNKAFAGSSNNIETIDGEAVKGEEFMEFYPNQDSLWTKATEIFYKPVD